MPLRTAMGETSQRIETAFRSEGLQGVARWPISPTGASRLARSWRDAPRPMHLVYVNPRNAREHGDVFRDGAPFVRVANGDDFAVYGAR
jgi:hypothetical protein